ncbi:flagellar hook-basal body complex protein [Clostridium thermobutyricum]|uniref:flagellar hook-basal body complex protein n=1 Tax=Clostridium thermobutyricum TaxID=29372 RepID=UPI0018ABAF0E|nr:flagellar hook-basal body complex protein [Clostridium thermobutyricum]
MIRTLYTSKSGMNANQNKLDVISNNLANSNTIGYKKVDVGFKDLLNESLNRKGYPINNKNANMGTGVKTSEWYRDNGQGNLLETLRGTDLSIDGQGFFKIIGKDGSSAYTRDGSFSIDGNGRLVDGRGNKVYLEYINGRNEGNIKFTTNNFLIDKEGSVFLKEEGKFNKVAEIPTYIAIGDESFKSIGENLYLPVDSANVYRTRDCDIYQGVLEGSNVDIAQEFTDMIVTQRAFQLSSKSLTTADEMWGMINNMRGR